MSIVNLLAPDAHLLVGIEDDADGSLRVYVDHRAIGIHSHVDDSDAKAQIRDAWAASYRGHQSITIPAAALCDCPPPTTSGAA